VAYTISVQHGAEEPVVIHATPSSFHVEAGDDGAVNVKICWCRNALRDDWRGYQAVVGSWPGMDTVHITVMDEDEEPVFSGVVTSVFWDHDKVCIKATDADGAPEPVEMTVVADPEDTSRRTASITVDNFGAGEVGIDFGDDTPNETNPGDGVTITTHAYTPGMYTVVATDVDQPSRTVAKVIIIPFPSPETDLTVTVTPEPADPSRQIGIIHADNHGNGQVIVSFGDGTPVSVNPGDGTTPTVHAWNVPGDYTITVTDVDQPWRFVTVDVTIPFPV
jgi:hypothetical protein